MPGDNLIEVVDNTSYLIRQKGRRNSAYCITVQPGSVVTIELMTSALFFFLK